MKNRKRRNPNKERENVREILTDVVKGKGFKPPKRDTSLKEVKQEVKQ